MTIEEVMAITSSKETPKAESDAQPVALLKKQGKKPKQKQGPRAEQGDRAPRQHDKPRHDRPKQDRPKYDRPRTDASRPQVTESVASVEPIVNEQSVETLNSQPTEAPVHEGPKFSDLALSGDVQKALKQLEHVHPTPIQQQAIPVVLSGADLLGCAQTGTGKTAAFALPILTKLGRGSQATVPKAPRVLVLAPTRELAAQISDSFRKYGKHLKVYQTVVFGGVNQNPQVQAMRKGVHILTATPGRLLDLINQGHIKLDRIDTLVLDEADRMLDMGFLPDLKRIIAMLPEQRQSLCFSATMPREVADLAHSLLRDPQQVTITPESSTTELVEQKLMLVSGGGKRDLLNTLIKSDGVQRVLVFTRTKRRADVVAKQLQQADIRADAIHGDKTQRARTNALSGFKTGRTQVLVATDVAARGIDVEGISHVINYDLPQDPESYVHRIGRTGRAKATGIAITFYEANERGKIRAIERTTKVQLLPESERGSHKGSPRSNGGPRHSGGSKKYGERKQYGNSGSNGERKQYGQAGSKGKSYGGKKSYKPRSSDSGSSTSQGDRETASTSNSGGNSNGYQGSKKRSGPGGNAGFKPRRGPKPARTQS